MAAGMFFIFVITIIAIALFVWLMITVYQEGPKPQDYTIVDNFMPQYTNNFSSGILLSVDIGDKRNGYTFIPKDVDYYGRRKNKNKEKITPQTVYIDKRKAISMPRSTFSGERNRLWLLPVNPEDIPEIMKSTPLGKALMTMIDNINNKETEVEVIRAGADRVRDIYGRMGDGEISSAEIDRLEAAHANILKQSSKEEDKKSILGGNPMGHTQP